MHSDVGGFAGDNLDYELDVRWLQYGVFNPIFRPHAQEEVPREPVFRSEKAKRLAKQAIELRYKLLPYNYNLMFENYTTGKPLMRPLLFEEPDNTDLFNYSKTYLWGNDILVSPVVEAGKKEQEVYFPKDNVWFDFYTDEKVKGGQVKVVQLDEAHIPTYIRSGSFIPTEKQKQQSTTQYNFRDIELHYYHDNSIYKSQRSIYDDKAYNNEYNLKDDYMFNHFNSKYKGNTITIDIKSELGKKSEFSSRVTSVVVHGITDAPRKVTINGAKVKFKYQDGKLSFPNKYYAQERKKQIKIKLKR
jgi:alpha-glucosidase (family GH31 glycosyl hydrolase)